MLTVSKSDIYTPPPQKQIVVHPVGQGKQTIMPGKQHRSVTVTATVTTTWVVNDTLPIRYGYRYRYRHQYR